MGRLESDPSISWYEGEIGFFDYFIIPLAKKLEKCDAFGVGSHEYRTYALKNRKEWAEKGKHIVATYLTKYNTSAVTENNKFDHQLWC
jgi:hypothetical protein